MVTIRICEGESHLFELPKKRLASECLYFKACLKAKEDPYPNLTDALADLTLEDEYAFEFILEWFKICKKIRCGQDSPPEEPEISLANWVDRYSNVSHKEWTEIFCLAEALIIPRLITHVGTAIELRAVDAQILPSLKTVIHLYEYGKKYCRLKNVFIDMYAIAAMEPKDVFGPDKERYPLEFVQSVDSYQQSWAYSERRSGRITCQRLPDDDVD